MTDDFKEEITTRCDRHPDGPYGCLACDEEVHKTERRRWGEAGEGARLRIAELEEQLAGAKDPWTPSGEDYDRSIHSNPDALAWAEFFCRNFPHLGADVGLMTGWFANAMEAVRVFDDAKVSHPPSDGGGGGGITSSPEAEAPSAPGAETCQGKPDCHAPLLPGGLQCSAYHFQPCKVCGSNLATHLCSETT